MWFDKDDVMFAKRLGCVMYVLFFSAVIYLVTSDDVDKFVRGKK